MTLQEKFVLVENAEKAGIKNFIDQKVIYINRAEKKLYHYRDVAISNGHKHFDWDNYADGVEKRMDGNIDKVEMCIKYKAIAPNGSFVKREVNEVRELMDYFYAVMKDFSKRVETGEFNQYKEVVE
jgi:hypothetical protein